MEKVNQKNKSIIIIVLFLISYQSFAQSYSRLKNRHLGNYLHTEYGKPELKKDVPKNWYSAMWEFEPVSNTNYVRLKSRHQGKYLHTEYGKPELKKDVPKDWYSAMWVFEPIANTNYYRLKSRHQNKYLHTEFGKPELKKDVPKNWYSAMWLIENSNIITPKNFGEGCITTKEAFVKNKKRHIGTIVENARIETTFQLVNNSIRATVNLKYDDYVSATWSKIIFKGGGKEIAGFDVRYVPSLKPNYKTYEKIVNVTTLPKGGAEVIGCNEGDITEIRAAYGKIKLIGDTGGEDISDDYDCKCDAKLVDIIFSKIAIQYKDEVKETCIVKNDNAKPKYEFTLYNNNFEFTFTDKDSFNPNDFEVFVQPNVEYKFKLKVLDKSGIKNIEFIPSINISSNNLRNWSTSSSTLGKKYTWEGNKNNPRCSVVINGTVTFNPESYAYNETFILNIQNFYGNNLIDRQIDVTIKEDRKNRVKYFFGFKN